MLLMLMVLCLKIPQARSSGSVENMASIVPLVGTLLMYGSAEQLLQIVSSHG